MKLVDPNALGISVTNDYHYADLAMWNATRGLVWRSRIYSGILLDRYGNPAAIAHTITYPHMDIDPDEFLSAIKEPLAKLKLELEANNNLEIPLVIRLGKPGDPQRDILCRGLQLLHVLYPLDDEDEDEDEDDDDDYYEDDVDDDDDEPTLRRF